MPIQSFIEAYCLIFTEESDHPKEKEERLKIFEAYKQLINEILERTFKKQEELTIGMSEFMS